MKRPGGQAHGLDRAYQELAREIVRQFQDEAGLVPYTGDGIDVPFSICGTEVRFDVALKDSTGRLLVIECKRWKGKVKQGDIFKFAQEVECLRQDLSVEVSGIFVTHKDYQ